MNDQLQRKLKSSNHARGQMTEMRLLYLLERTIHEYIDFSYNPCRMLYIRGYSLVLGILQRSKEGIIDNIQLGLKKVSLVKIYK